MTTSKKHRVRTRTIPHAHKWQLDAGAHPRGILSYGNLLLTGRRDIRPSGLGSLAILPDDFLVDILLFSLPVAALGKLAQASRFLYLAAYHDDLWRARLSADFGSRAEWSWRGTWRMTYRDELLRERGEPAGTDEVPIKVRGAQSDFLFQPFYLSKLKLSQFEGRQTIQRRSASELTVAQFIDHFARPGLPLILTDLLTTWPASTKWTPEWLLSQFSEHPMRAEAFDLPLKTYLDYTANLPPCTDAPLYLFSSLFPESLEKDFTHPEYFTPDLLDLLPGSLKPTNTWLVLGPARSGSTFHIDPNGTSAFNALLKGRKKWVFYPPNQTPPGVYVSPDGSEVTAPQSLLEWYTGFYTPHSEGMLEGVCEEGECMFVPSGWWHSVLNLEETVALTRNFCLPSDLNNVLSFFRDKSCEISGVSGLDEESGDRYGGNNLAPSKRGKGVDMYSEFSRVLQSTHPELWKEWESHDLETREAKRKRTEASGGWSQLVKRKTDNEGTQKKGFSFGFVADDSDVGDE